MHVLAGLGLLSADDLGTVEAEILPDWNRFVIAFVGLDALQQCHCAVLVVPVVSFVQTLSDYFSCRRPNSLSPSDGSMVCQSLRLLRFVALDDALKDRLKLFLTVIFLYKFFLHLNLLDFCRWRVPLSRLLPSSFSGNQTGWLATNRVHRDLAPE